MGVRHASPTTLPNNPTKAVSANAWNEDHAGLTVGPDAPENPEVGDLWVDTSNLSS